jgi:hypothetical protein
VFTKHPKQLVLVAAVAILALPACSTMNEQTSEFVSSANQSVNLAREAGAEVYAPQQFNMATRHINAAQQALDNGDYESARRNAEKAMADIELAEAKTNAVIQYEQVAELVKEIDKLENR